MAKQYVPLNISTLDGGKALEAFQQAVRKIESDYSERSEQEGPRKAILTVSIDQEIDKETGAIRGPLLQWEVGTKVPSTKSAIIRGVLKDGKIAMPLFEYLTPEEEAEEAAARG